MYSPGHTIRIADRSSDATLQAMFLAFGVRIYLLDFTR
jgi:hypothetical protein